MLARLDQEVAPARASVNREGDLLRIVGAEEVTAARVADVVADLGYFAEPIAAPPVVGRWFGADDVGALSREEAVILAGRWAKELATEGIIGEAEHVVDPLRIALLQAFGQAARTGTIEGMRIDEDPIRRVLAGHEAKAVIEWIARKLSPQHQP